MGKDSNKVQRIRSIIQLGRKGSADADPRPISDFLAREIQSCSILQHPAASGNGKCGEAIYPGLFGEILAYKRASFLCASCVEDKPDQIIVETRLFDGKIYGYTQTCSLCKRNKFCVSSFCKEKK